ncbi:MAG: hypothetical protein SFV24_16990 [Gemmatimonadales bacterium]|nr:hypothetical protein [Gemmatimonadales bacterium]
MTTIRPRRSWLRGLALTLGALLVAFLTFAIPRLGEELPPPATNRQSGRLARVTIFGATGRVGEGILTAALRDTAVTRIQVVTRRTSPAIERGLASGKVHSVTHDDYLDYGPLAPVLAETDVIYWAIGTSTLNVDSAEYARIHREFPQALLRQWAAVRGRDRRPTFHYVSGAGADLAAWARWAREKARAEQELAALGEHLGVTVVSYRPAGVVPVEGNADFGLRFRVTNLIFLPTKISVEANAIGEAMLEVTARGEVTNGQVLPHRELIRLAAGYRRVTGRGGRGAAGPSP